MPAARRSNSEPTTTTFFSAATLASAFDVGPGIGSARSKLAWSSDWQKYWVVNSSGRQTTWAPRAAASRILATAFSTFSAGLLEHRIWTRPSVKVSLDDIDMELPTIVAEARIASAAAVRSTRRRECRQDVAEQPIADARGLGHVAARIGQDAFA